MAAVAQYSLKHKMQLFLMDYDLKELDNQDMIKNIRLQCKIYGIPMYVFLTKFIGRLKSRNIQNITRKLLDCGFVDTEDIPLFQNIIDDTEKISDLKKMSDISDTSEYKKIMDVLCPNNNRDSDYYIHAGIPSPHKLQQSLIHFMCPYDGCFRKFTKYRDLKIHLGVFNNNICDIAKNHMLIANELKLSPKKITGDNITKCQHISCCNKKFESPMELIKHYRQFGVPNFWNYNMKVNPINDYLKIHISDMTKLTVYDVSDGDCMLCMDDVPKIIYNPCGHLIYCIKCVNKNKPKRCDICNEKIFSYFCS